MEISINNFNYKNLAEDKKVLEKYSEKQIDELKKEVDELKKEVDARFIGFWTHTLIVLILFIIAIVGNIEWLAITLTGYLPIWFFLVTTSKWRKKRAFLKAKKQNENTPVINYVDVLKIFLGKEEEVEKLGKVFLVKSNEVTGNKKREYFGDVLIFLEKDKNEIYLLNEEKLYQKEFYISDVVAFSRVSAEGLGNVKGKDDDSKMVDYIHQLDNHADRLRRDGGLIDIKNELGGSHTIQTKTIKADSIEIEVKKARDELHKKREQEEKRLKDELEIKLLKFADGDYLLISHLEDSAVSHLEKMIEIQ